MSARHVVRFGSFEFDVASGELRRSGRQVALQTQPAQVLAQLVSAPGEVVTREQLRRTLWADDTFVDFDAALNVAINKIRQALRDSATAPRFVETLPKRGYRFVADVRPADEDAGAVPSAPPVTGAIASREEPLVDDREGGGSRPVAVRRHGRWSWVAGFAVAITLPVLWSGTRPAQPSTSMSSLAVLPFRPLVSDMPDDELQVALAEAVIVKLGELRQLRVPSIRAVQRYAKADTDARAAGIELGVDAVLEGTLLRRDGNVRLTARLIDVNEGTSLWAGRWDVPWTDIFTVQDAIAAEVTGALAVQLGADEQERLHHHPTNLAAYDAYLRARALMVRLTANDSRRAIEKLEEAVRLDPRSARAHATLAFAYIMVAITDGPPEPYATLARGAAHRARELDPAVGEAWGGLGRVLYHFDWNAVGGLEHMRRALALEPNNPFVLHCASRLIADSGHVDEAMALNERALALDPTSPLANRDKTTHLVMARRYVEAIAQARKALELDPYDPSVYRSLAMSYERLGREREAIDAYIKPLTFSDEHRERVERLRAAAGRGGLRAFYEQRLAMLLESDSNAHSAEIARIHMKLGDAARALDQLDALYADRWPWIPSLRHDPEWDPLRTDPRFERLMARLDQHDTRRTAPLETTAQR
jgi:TolB-like protein/DNA-binding winged helix-turn-helix (wHTH) protein/Tfp pilus assembly protein PilF